MHGWLKKGCGAFYNIRKFGILKKVNSKIFLTGAMLAYWPTGKVCHS